ncbi:hypothetical protein NDU88_002454 [Pleurodeles waltl]|uniref:Uncharacterized protein n=1 Tax=Pleurodeles waltl TaxID=8319 RepID=A0AAV7MMP8_PLEWA|nr:hypothetical protein NDU88_002454 [Pleurodeles waltl]
MVELPEGPWRKEAIDFMGTFVTLPSKEFSKLMKANESSRWRPDFPADRHHRSSPSPVCTQLSFTRRESRGCRERCAPAAWTAAGALRFFWRLPQGLWPQGQVPEDAAEELSAALALELRSFSSRPSATPPFFGSSSWRMGRPEGAKAEQDPSLLTGTAESRPRRNQKGQKATGPRIERTQQSLCEGGPAEDNRYGKGHKELGSNNVYQHDAD